MSLACLGQDTISLSSSSQISSIYTQISLYSDSTGTQTFNEIRNRTFTKNIEKEQKSDPVDQWLHFLVKNTDSVPHQAKVSVAFVDRIEAYIFYDSTLHQYETGDLLPLSKRKVQIGQMCFVDFDVLPGKTSECYLKIHSSTTISQQFRPVALRSVQLYAEKAFQDRFESSRIYQALFYGAIFIMLFYNLFIYSTTLSVSYLVYVKFLFWIILFMASNNGFVAELILPDYPRLDLYLRFLSAPLLLISFVLFSKQYLETKRHSPFLNILLNYVLVLFFLICVMMCAGGWRLGRTLSIELSVVTFLFILYVATVVMRKGYTPAKYFMIANFLLMIGATFYALERYHLVSHNLLTQYSVQLSVVFQSIFFSIGLADRINLVSKQITEVKLAKSKLEQQQEAERQKLVEEKNAALEKSNLELDTFIYKTAHDIRGPLARLIGLSNIGLLDVKDPQALKYLGLLKTNADFLNYLLNRLSTAHEIKNQAVFRSEFNLYKLIQDVLTNLSFHEEYHKVKFHLQVDKELRIWSDLGLLKFVLLNLFDNAIKFRDNALSGLSDIHVTATIADHQLRLEVQDFGVGVREEEVPYLFDMFSKAAGKFHTPGLGLYMTQLCVHKLNGTIHLQNPSNPTVFACLIPC